MGKTLSWVGLWGCGDQVDCNHFKSSAFFNLDNVPSVLLWEIQVVYLKQV